MTQEEEGLILTPDESESSGALITRDPFRMTIEQARDQINYTIDMYNLVREVASSLLTDKDRYYMSMLNNPKATKPKEGESQVVGKPGVDKLIGFFKIETLPDTKKIDGGYEVTVIARDRSGRYIATGTGICNRYEKKYSWIKADKEEYDAADTADRREVMRSGYNGSYKVQQIKTDERSIAHTLVSMATKRARASLLRQIFPDLTDYSFEGEGAESDYQYTKPEQTPSNTVMKDSEIKAFKDELKKLYSTDQIKEAVKGVTGGAKIEGMTQEISLAITTYLKDNCYNG